MKYIYRYNYLLIFLLIFFCLFFPSHVFAQSDCDSDDPRWNVGVFIKDSQGRNWGRVNDSCVQGRIGVQVNRTNVAGNWIDNPNGITQRCENNDGFNQGGFDVRTFQCPNLNPSNRVIMDVVLPAPNTCIGSTWRYENSSNGSILLTGTGCHIDIYVPNGMQDYNNRVILTMGTAAPTPTAPPRPPDPPRLPHICNTDGTVTLRWTGIAGSYDYVWRLNNRTDIWYTSTTDSYGNTTGTSVRVPIVYNVSHDWTVTSRTSPTQSHTANSWSAAFTCPLPPATPTPYINIQVRNPQGAATAVRGLGFSYNCVSWPVCFTTILENAASGSFSTSAGWQGGAGISLYSNQRLLSINPAPVGGAPVNRSNNRATPWYNNVLWNNYWWESYPNSGAPRSATFIVASVTPIPTATPPLSCGTVTVPSSPLRTGQPFSASISGISTTTTGCNLLFNSTSADTGTSTGTPRRCDMASTVPNGSFTYNVRGTNGASFISCSVGNFCGDNTAPPIPGSPPPATASRTLSCSWSGRNGTGTNLYTVNYAYTAVTDNGCVGMNSTPYWAQLTNNATFANAFNSDNTWEAGAAGLVTSITNQSEGNTIYARTRSRDGLNNQSAWSPTGSIVLNSTNCTGVPTPTAIPPTPTPAHWFKLRDSSFNRVTTDPNIQIPSNPLRFNTNDADDPGPTPQLIIGQHGLLATNTNLTIGGNGTFSTNRWYKNNYAITNPHLQSATTLNTFKESLKATKNIKTITTISDVEANKVNIREGDLTISTAIPNGPYVIFVNGDINLNVNGPTPYRFNPTSQSIALIATGDIFIHQGYAEANGIFIASNIELTANGVATPQSQILKINGNLISTANVDTKIRITTDARAPSLFVVFKPKMYLDLLPFLSTIVQEGRQLE